MKSRNRKVLGISCAIVIFVLCAILVNQGQVRYVQPDYAVYNTESSIINAATDIIVGEVISTKSEKIKIAFTEGRKYEKDEDKMVYTISEVKVIRTLKGDIKTGDIIQVKQLGDGKRIIDQTVVENGGYYVKGDKKIFFLKSFKEFGVPYSVVNPIQGQIAFVNDIIIKSENNPLFKSIKNEQELIESIEKYK